MAVVDRLRTNYWAAHILMIMKELYFTDVSLAGEMFLASVFQAQWDHRRCMTDYRTMKA